MFCAVSKVRTNRCSHEVSPSHLLPHRASAYTDSRDLENADTDPTTVYECVQAGQTLQCQLVAFAFNLRESARTHDNSVAWMYYHALSIYLSGIFDYTLGEVCAAPSLRDDVLMAHVEGILKRSDEALQQSQVSQVFLLLPLRIAGNRCSNSKQCREVLERLGILQNQFAVATAFRSELLQIWSSQSLNV